MSSMASKFEVLEYIRVYGPYVPMKKISDVFGSTGRRAIMKLQKQGYVKKYKKKTIESDGVLVSDRVEYEEVDKGHGGLKIYLSLTERAENWLESKNAESFYDLPSAMNANSRLIRSRGRTLRDIEDL